MKKRLALLLFLAGVVTVFAQEDPALHNRKEKKASRLGEYKGYTGARYGGYRYNSFYLRMPDSVNIALDVYLPARRKKDEKIPAILYLTRYVRSLEAIGSLRWLKHPILGQISEREIRFFTSHGYACIIADARGSGASSSARKMDFTPEEIGDARYIMDWICAQPWHNGKIGTTGISYVGTTAELMIANQHPAHVAAIPRSAIFDLYEDLAFPGGLRQGPFVDIWGQTTAALDRGDIGFVSKKARGLIRGINPVKKDKKRIQLYAAMQDHTQNHQVYKDILQIEYRDEIHARLGVSVDAFSVHQQLPRIRAASTAIFRIGGYYDGALGGSLIKGLLNTPNTQRVLIGPWDHGPHNYASPHAAYTDVRFNVYAEMLRFFDFHLKSIPNGIDKEARIHYFTMGSERWDTASVWPPAGTQNVCYYFSGAELSRSDSNSAPVQRTHIVNYDFGSGGGARWNSLTPLFRGEPNTNYLHWEEKTRSCLQYLSDAATESFTLSGSVIFNLWLQSDAPDGGLFIFLEEQDSAGRIHYITEAQVRLRNRKPDLNPAYLHPGPAQSHRTGDAEPMPAGIPQEIRIGSLPVSYTVAKGSRLRISIAGADKGHSDRVNQDATRYIVYSGAGYSCLLLPLGPKNINSR